MSLLSATDFVADYLTVGKETFQGLNPTEIQKELDKAQAVVAADLNMEPEDIPDSLIYKDLIATYTKHRICITGLIKKDSVSSHLQEYQRLIARLRAPSFGSAYAEFETEEEDDV